MNFYNVDDLTQEKHHSQGIDITSMSKVFEAISKKNKNTKLDDVMSLFIILFNEGKLSENNPNLEYFGEFKVRKKVTNYAIVKPGKEFFVNKDGTDYASKVVNGVLMISSNEKLLTLEAQERNKFKDLSLEEKKVINWLEYGETGTSSITMCAALYPQLKKIHHKLVREDTSTPHDVPDLGRCINFLKEVPEARKNISILKSVNTVWSKLADQWDNLENKYKNSDYKACNEIIKKCEIDSSIKFKI